MFQDHLHMEYVNIHTELYVLWYCTNLMTHYSDPWTYRGSALNPILKDKLVQSTPIRSYVHTYEVQKSEKVCM